MPAKVPFHTADLNRLRPRPAHVSTHCGQALLVTALNGFVEADVQGFYYRKTRFLSKWRLAVDGDEPLPVSAIAVDQHSSIAYYLAPSPAGDKAGPQPGVSGSGGEIVRHGIELQVNACVGDGLHYTIYVTNHALAAAEIELRWQLDADFADWVEAEQGRRQQNAPIERHWRAGEGCAELVLHYRHPRLDHTSKIRFSGGAGFAHREDGVACRLQLPPQQPIGLSIEILPIFAAAQADAVSDPLPIDVGPGYALRVSAGNPQVQAAWDRAVSDLSSMALLEGAGEERRALIGGIPKYIGLFGRDALMTAFQASLHAPETLRGTLSLLAHRQAAEYDDRFDKEPGRILHQRQLGPLELLEKTPFAHYYGDYAAPGLFLIDLAWHLSLTGDKEFFLSLQDKALATLEWMDRDGDRDHDGFYEYETKAGSWGEKNQGWKDSEEAVLYEDGHIVENPIALVEIQGCYYAAKQAMGLAFALLGDQRRATELFEQARRLKERFNQAFWITDLGYFGLALDPAKRLVRTIAADPGQCLAYGIIDDDKARAVADRLMQPDLFSGWGIRTLSANHPAFNPFGYHLGSVWPASNSLIGFGLKRYGFNSELQRLAKGLFDASGLFDFDRLPEAIGGHARDAAHPHPGIYPDACSPQAWSAAAVPLLLQAMLGLIPVAPRQTLIVDPDLPDWLPELTLTGLRIGGEGLGLRFRRDADGYTRHEVIDRHGEVRIYRPDLVGRGSDNFPEMLHALL